MLKQKTAIVTGSTSGIGEGIARSLASAGVNIMLNGFGDPAAIESLRKTLTEAYQVKVSYSPADLSHPEQIEGMVDQAVAELGEVDILVNNAGIQYVELVENFPPEKWDAILAINLSSAFHAVRCVMPSMKKRKWGRIINVASAHGLVASAKKSAYVAAKHGIIGFTKSIALETAGAGITSNAVCPGWVFTPLVDKQIHAIAEAQKISYEEARLALLSEKQPSKEFVSVEEIGALVVFLSGDSARSITGSSISIDGGWTAQ